MFLYFKKMKKKTLKLNGFLHGFEWIRVEENLKTTKLLVCIILIVIQKKLKNDLIECETLETIGEHIKEVILGPGMKILVQGEEGARGERIYHIKSAIHDQEERTAMNRVTPD